ncbi:MAG TPA: hypothetical protein VFV95_05935 [Vicinamibacterales bacterium]|nr:hypothetical protein [Vicinamibacterales bacterium]
MAALLAGAVAVMLCATLGAQRRDGSQRRDAFVERRDHPAIQYPTAAVSDPVARLNASLRDGKATLAYDSRAGYLTSVLQRLNIPIESQALVFSPTSFQSDLINMRNPRAVFFTDTVAVGWVRGGSVLEVAALDPRQGVIFYGLDQKNASTPQFTRNDQCLACHLSWDTLGVPGLMTTSMYPLPDDPNAYANGFTTVQGSPLEQRWGGWWVTGATGGARHMGNVPVMPADARKKPNVPAGDLKSLDGIFDLTGYPTPYSDVVAQLVLAHQTRMTNLITRVGWEARLATAVPSADASARVQEAAADLVDYMLFVDEAPLARPVSGTSGFAEQFARTGPRDSKGRSLRDLDLQRRLFRYPCSYMIYTEAFDALPQNARDAVYARLIHVLAGRDTAPRYKVLSQADRRAVIEILRETKKGLPAGFVSL